jgi:hypothetical protein
MRDGCGPLAAGFGFLFALDLVEIWRCEVVEVELICDSIGCDGVALSSSSLSGIASTSSRDERED